MRNAEICEPSETKSKQIERFSNFGKPLVKHVPGQSCYSSWLFKAAQSRLVAGARGYASGLPGKICDGDEEKVNCMPILCPGSENVFVHEFGGKIFFCVSSAG